MDSTAQRKIVQIATAAAENGHSLYALCDDGTVWDYHEPHVWKQVAPISRSIPFVAPKTNAG